MLTFDEASHTYFWQGRAVINVTRVLSPLVDFSMVPADTLERARQEGVAIHKMVELDVLGELDVDGLPDWLKTRYSAWRRFLAESGFDPEETEKRVYHPLYGYAGTPDLVGKAHRERWLVDLKRSFAAGPVIGLQLAAYKEAWEAGNKAKHRVKRRYALRLLESGDYRLEPFEEEGDFQTFLALLKVHRWRETHQRAA